MRFHISVLLIALSFTVINANAGNWNKGSANNFSASSSGNAWVCAKKSMQTDAYYLVLAKNLAAEMTRAAKQPVSDGLMYDVVKDVVPPLLDKHDNRFREAWDQFYRALDSELAGEERAVVKKAFSGSAGCEVQNTLSAAGGGGLPLEVQEALATAKSETEAKKVFVDYIVGSGAMNRREANIFMSTAQRIMPLMMQYHGPVVAEMMADFANAFRTPERYPSVQRLMKSIGR